MKRLPNGIEIFVVSATYCDTSPGSASVQNGRLRAAFSSGLGIALG
jgi:hypothetical protein